MLRRATWPIFMVSAISILTNGCKRSAPDTYQVKSDSDAVKSVPVGEPSATRKWCQQNSGKCLSHTILASMGPIPCMALYRLRSKDSSAKLDIHAFDEMGRGFTTTATGPVRRNHKARFRDWPTLQTYDELSASAFGFGKVPKELADLPVGIPKRGASGAGIYRPVAYVLAVENHLLDGKKFLVTYQPVGFASAKIANIVKEEFTTQVVPYAETETEIKQHEMCLPTQSIAWDSAVSRANSEGTTPYFIAAEYAISKQQERNAFASYDRLVFFVGLIPGVGSALRVEQGCYAGEGDCIQAVLGAIADAATFAVPVTGAVTSSARAAFIVRAGAASANFVAGSYSAFKATQEILAGNNAAGINYSIDAIIRIASGGMMVLEMVQTTTKDLATFSQVDRARRARWESGAGFAGDDLLTVDALTSIESPAGGWKSWDEFRRETAFLFENTQQGAAQQSRAWNLYNQARTSSGKPTLGRISDQIKMMEQNPGEYFRLDVPFEQWGPAENDFFVKGLLDRRELIQITTPIDQLTMQTANPVALADLKVTGLSAADAEKAAMRATVTSLEIAQLRKAVASGAWKYDAALNQFIPIK